MKVYCGTSGFNYDDFEGVLYPEGLPETSRLEYFSKQFGAVEINATFYRLPENNTIKKWYNKTDDDFRISIKGSKYITHQKKLKMDSDLKEAVYNLQDKALLLEDKLAFILWQLPGNLHADKEKIRKFSSLLKRDVSHVMEFRDGSWFSDEIINLVREHNIIPCAVSCPNEDIPFIIKTVGGKCYIRLHGKKQWYDDEYSEEDIDEILDMLKKRERRIKEAYIMFNNTKGGHAAKNCRYLKKRAEEMF